MKSVSLLNEAKIFKIEHQKVYLSCDLVNFKSSGSFNRTDNKFDKYHAELK